MSARKVTRSRPRGYRLVKVWFWLVKVRLLRPVEHSLEHPITRPRYFAAGLVGVGVYAVAIGVSVSFPLEPPPNWSKALPSALVLIGFLLVPASIFAPVVGAMFPKYWSATPVTVIRRGPLNLLLWLLVATLVYAVTSLVTAPMVPLKQRWLAVPLLLVVVAFVSVQAVRLIAYSLAILDPDRLTEHLRDTAINSSSGRRTRTAFNDLCRLTRGLMREERPTAAQRGIESMSKVHGVKARWLGDDSLGLAARVLRECNLKWAGGRTPSLQRARRAAKDCWYAMELTGDHGAEDWSDRPVADRSKRIDC